MKHKKLKTIFIVIFTIAICLNLRAEDSGTAAKSASQRRMMMKEFGLSELQAHQIQKLSFVRTKQIDSLNKLGLSKEELSTKREECTETYYFKVRELLTPEQRIAYPVDALKAARTNEVTMLRLKPRVTVEMGKLKASFENALRNLPENRKERKTARLELEAEYYSQVKSLIGDAKFKEWMDYRNSKIERVFINEYGFTKQQFKKYQDLENKQAVEILKIKDQAIPKDEKARKIQKVKEAKIQSLREYLPERQFNKWYQDYQKKESKKTSK